RCQRTAVPGRRSGRRPRRSSCGPRESRSERRRCSAKDQAANTKPARGKGGAQRRTTENRPAYSAADCPWGQKCLPENACGPFLTPDANLSRGANRPEPHHYAKKEGPPQWRNLAGVYSWLPARMPCQKAVSREYREPYVSRRLYWRCHRYAKAITTMPSTIR